MSFSPVDRRSKGLEPTCQAVSVPPEDQAVIHAAGLVVFE